MVSAEVIRLVSLVIHVFHFTASEGFLEFRGRSRDSNLVDSASSIRLSQRLSHACLSINVLYCETANGSLYQL
jgi:hypothetical protein